MQMVDRDREEGCRARVDHNGMLRCIPEASDGIESYHLAADCSDAEVEYSVIDGVCETSAPPYVREVVALDCGSGTRLRNVGDPVGAALYNPGGCVEQIDARSYFEINNNVAANQFDALEEHFDGTADRLRRIFLAADDDYGMRIGWYDSHLETPCGFAEAEDGVTRCLPAALAVSEFFSDDACTDAFDGAIAGGCSSEAMHLSKPGMLGGTRLLAAGEAAGAKVYKNPGCAEVTLLDGEAVYPADYEVAPSSFVEVEESIDL